MKIGKLLKVALNTKKNLEKIIFFSFSEVYKKWQRKVLNKVLNITLVFVLSAIAAISQPLVVDAFNNSLQRVNLTNLKSNSKLNLSENPSGLFDQGKALYESGQLREAIERWKQVASIYQQQNQLLALSTTFNNLSLAYQGLGEWQLAEKSISQSLQVARSLTPVTKESQREIARALDTSGNLSISTGKTEKALVFWKEAEILYDQTGDEVGKIRNILNQEQALKNQGFYRRSRQILEDLLPKLQSQPDSLLKAIGFSRYGEILKLTGELNLAKQNLDIGWKILDQVEKSASSAIADIRDQQSLILVELANILKSEDNLEGAWQSYSRAVQLASKTNTKLQAQLSLLALEIELENFAAASQVHSAIASNIADLPKNVSNIRALINYGDTTLKLAKLAPQTSQASLRFNAAQVLARAVQQAQDLGDQYSLAYALGSLGSGYEQSQQITEAIALTEKALAIAQSIKAPDIAYRWQWQLGRLYKAKGDTKDAIAAYSESIKTLTQLRSDLAFISANVQFSFRESVEPVYRQFVSLLLQTEQSTVVADEKQKNLTKAQSVIESLQLAELVNFFRADCLNAAQIDINKVDAKAAVIYPIILEDRLEVIVSLPQQPLKHYSTAVPVEEIDLIVSELRNDLRDFSSLDYLENSQRLYNWMIRPIAADLDQDQVKTIVFVLDGSLRNIPMAVLNDGKQFLMEKYSIALTPGLQLVDPKPIAKQKLSALTGGLTDAQQGFSALPSVTLELQEVRNQLPTARVLLDTEFTTSNIEKELATTPVPIIHLATHGNFSSQLVDTFLLTYDGRLNIENLTQLLSAKNRSDTEPIELLILSACQTAVGDKRAALGMAGMAVRAGARSTIASLWSVDDAATSKFMIALYQSLSSRDVTKAESLRFAQQTLIKEEAYNHPYFWAPFVLLGNWL
ncbi:MAG: hypothetical protein DCE90_09620 [Pseudanabaena sp.]|nr:MAG: hypothetical protein DCE90_09620 [Pseudanabaena sp.]